MSSDSAAHKANHRNQQSLSIALSIGTIDRRAQSFNKKKNFQFVREQQKKNNRTTKKTREQNKSFEHQLTIGATDKINCRIESNECHEIEKKTKRDRIFIET